jgi:hypothetical protein
MVLVLAYSQLINRLLAMHCHMSSALSYPLRRSHGKSVLRRRGIPINQPSLRQDSALECLVGASAGEM